MSARQMAEAHRRAKKRGYEAFWEGKNIDDCPYKHSEWGNGGAWCIGWRNAKSAASKGARHAIYGNPLEAH